MRKNILRKRKDIIVNEFINYVYDFYGKNGIYDMGATRDNITTATIDYISSLLSKKDISNAKLLEIVVSQVRPGLPFD